MDNTIDQATRRYLLTPVADYYAERGYDARATSEGCVIAIPGGSIVLTDTVEFRPDLGAAA